MNHSEWARNARILMFRGTGTTADCATDISAVALYKSLPITLAC
jgi:hypothetical protein